jgi:paraquat-inducible protein A
MTIACPDCGLLEDLPPLGPRNAAVCRLCRADLELTSGRSIAAALACTLATFVLLFPANLAPFLRTTVLGITRETHLASGVAAFWNHHWVLLAITTALLAVALPFLRFGLLTIVLGLLWAGRRPSGLGRVYRWALKLDLWAMPDVYLVGAMVGYSRVEARLPVEIGVGGYCLIAAALPAMLSRASLDQRTVWRALAPERDAPAGEAIISCTVCDLIMPLSAEGARCPRCGQRLKARKPYAVGRTLALVIAGFLLYLPANLYPMSVTAQIGRHVSYTIYDGVRDLFQAGFAPLGVLIFCTSIAIPMLKLAGLSWFLVSIKRRSDRHLVFKTKLYRVIDEIGRWSSIDPFTIAVFVPLMDFPPLITTSAGIGATAFITVVVITMIASEVFDPRLMWDAARKPET